MIQIIGKLNMKLQKSPADKTLAACFARKGPADCACATSSVRSRPSRKAYGSREKSAEGTWCGYSHRPTLSRIHS
jgi:hypothetical protein